MKFAQRKKWLGLCEATADPSGQHILCCFCKFRDVDCDGELDCTHPLDAVRCGGQVESAWEGGDCWGFRPDDKFDELAARYGVTVEQCEQAYDEACRRHEALLREQEAHGVGASLEVPF